MFLLPFPNIFCSCGNVGWQLRYLGEVQRLSWLKLIESNWSNVVRGFTTWYFYFWISLDKKRQRQLYYRVELSLSYRIYLWVHAFRKSQYFTIWFDAKHDYKPSPSHSKCLSYLQTANCALIFQREWIGWCHNQSQSIVPMWDSVAWHHSDISQWSECCISGIFVLYLDRAQWRGFQCVCKQHSCEQKAFNYTSSTRDWWART